MFGWHQTHNLMGWRLASTARSGLNPKFYGLTACIFWSRDWDSQIATFPLMPPKQNKSVPLSSGATGRGSGWPQTHNLMGLRLASPARSGLKASILWFYGLHRLFGHGMENHKWRPSL